MRDYLIAMLVIPVLFGAWIVVQRIVKEFALRHPEFGPPREEGGGCGSSCREPVRYRIRWCVLPEAPAIPRPVWRSTSRAIRACW